MAAPRYKSRDEFTAAEEEAYRKDGTIPTKLSHEEAQALEAAGFDPESRRPLDDVADERDKRIRREEELEFEESLTVEDHVERMQRENRSVG